MQGWEREWYTPYQSEDPSPTIPTFRQEEEKMKNSRRLWVEQLRPIKKHWPALETRQSHTIEYGVTKIVPEGHCEENTNGPLRVTSNGTYGSGSTSLSGCIGLHLILYSIHRTATDKRWTMSHSNTPSVRNRSPLTARSSNFRCVSAAENHTAEQYSKTGRTKPRKHLSTSSSNSSSSSSSSIILTGVSVYWNRALCTVFWRFGL